MANYKSFLIHWAQWLGVSGQILVGHMLWAYHLQYTLWGKLFPAACCMCRWEVLRLRMEYCEMLKFACHRSFCDWTSSLYIKFAIHLSLKKTQITAMKVLNDEQSFPWASSWRLEIKSYARPCPYFCQERRLMNLFPHLSTAISESCTDLSLKSLQRRRNHDVSNY